MCPVQQPLRADGLVIARSEDESGDGENAEDRQNATGIAGQFGFSVDRSGGAIGCLSGDRSNGEAGSRSDQSCLAKFHGNSP